MLDIQDYLNPAFKITEFSPGTRVLDVGCGKGRQMQELQSKGCEVTGIDPDTASIAMLAAAGFRVDQGFAEKLPYPDNSFNAIVCNVVLPYCEERQAIAEWRRVLLHDGEVRAAYHGYGYALRLLFDSKSNLKQRFYGLRTLMNSWCYQITGWRIPGFLGDTLCQSEQRLAKIYRFNGFGLLTRYYSPFLWYGYPVFIFDHLKLHKKQ